MTGANHGRSRAESTTAEANHEEGQTKPTLKIF